MGTITMTSVAGGRRRIRPTSVAGMVRGEFPRQPHLADFLEQCFADLEEKRAPRFDEAVGFRLLTESSLLAALRRLRELLTAEFPFADANPLRGKMLRERFMPFRGAALHADLASQKYRPLHDRLEVFASGFLAAIAPLKGGEKELWYERLLVHIAKLAWLAVLPNTGMRTTLERLLDTMLNVEDEAGVVAAGCSTTSLFPLPQLAPTPFTLQLIK